MVDITDTLVLIQIKAFLNGQRALLNGVSDGEPTEWTKGYDEAVRSISGYIHELQGMVKTEAEPPWANTYKEPTK